MIPRPHNYAPLAAAERQKLDRWLKEKGCHCPACGKDGWGEAGLGRLPVASGRDATHTDGHPSVLLPCRDCGHLSFFCAFTVGLAQETPSTPTAEDLKQERATRPKPSHDAFPPDPEAVPKRRRTGKKGR